MKLFRCLAVLFILLLTASCASAVTLAWDPNTDAVDGYQVFFRAKGTTQMWHTDAIIHPVVTVEVLNKYLVPDVVYEFWAIAYNSSNGSSMPSIIIEYTRPGFVPDAATMPPEHVINLPVAPGNLQGN